MTLTNIDKPNLSIMRIPDDPDLLKAVGRMTIAHGHLELSVKRWIKSLAHIELIAADIITQDLSISNARNIVKRLISEMKGDNLKVEETVSRLFKKAEDLSAKRNKFAHAVWHVDDYDSSNFGITHKRRTEMAPTAGEINDVADEIERVAFELNHERLVGVLPMTRMKQQDSKDA